jgi:hypothetical protein
MPEAPERTCEELISNEGTKLLANRVEQPCGLDAGGYCNECARYVCAIHQESRHQLHDVARR